MTILCEPDTDRATHVASALGEQVQIVSNLADAAMALATGHDERVVIGAGVTLESARSFCAQLRAERPEVLVVLLRAELDERHAAELHATGFDNVVPEDDPDALAAAMSVEPSRLTGRVVTVFSPKGGAGTTTVAVNLAIALSAEGGRSVCLVDLDLSFGDVGIALQLAPQRTIFDAAGAGGSIAGQLDQVVTTYRPGLDCVLAPVGPADAEKVPAALLPELLGALSERYDVVIVDTPSQLSEHVLFALDASRVHILVTTPEVAATKDLRLTIDMLDALSYPAADRVLVLNKQSSKNTFSTADLVQAVGASIDVTVPGHADVTSSLDEGRPISATDRKHDVSKAIHVLADRVLGNTASSRPHRAGLRLRKRTA